MPKIIDKELIEFVSGFSLTKKSKKVLIECIKESGEDVYNENYELYNITKILIEKLPRSTQRDNAQLETTLDIMRAIEWLKKEKLV